jgi:hypothetical protein
MFPHVNLQNEFFFVVRHAGKRCTNIYEAHTFMMHLVGWIRTTLFTICMSTKKRYAYKVSRSVHVCRRRHTKCGTDMKQKKCHRTYI